MIARPIYVRGSKLEEYHVVEKNKGCGLGVDRLRF